MFPICLFFVYDGIIYFSVKYLDSIVDILRRKLACEVAPCGDFVSDVSIESVAKVFNSSSWEMEFAVIGDCVG